MSKQNDVKRRLVRRARAAEMLDTSISMLKRLEREGKLTPVRLGSRDVHYPEDEIDALANGDD